MLLAALAVVHAWFVDRPWSVAAWVALAGGTIIGIGAGRLIKSRLTFHAFDGLLAADVLQPQIRWRYIISWHITGLALLAFLALIARPAIVVVVMPAYLAGALIAKVTDSIGMPTRILGTTRPGWTFRARLHRPIGGATAAMLLLLSFVPARMLDIYTLMAVVGIETVLATLMLTSVDDAAVRFMTIAGHGSWRIMVRHARGLAAFLAIAVLGCWAWLGSVAGGVVAATGAAMFLLQTLRILAYRLHTKRFADLLVSILAGIFLLVAYSIPVALPVIALAMLWQLQRRGREKTWLLA